VEVSSSPVSRLPASAHPSVEKKATDSTKSGHLSRDVSPHKSDSQNKATGGTVGMTAPSQSQHLHKVESNVLRTQQRYGQAPQHLQGPDTNTDTVFRASRSVTPPLVRDTTTDETTAEHKSGDNVWSDNLVKEKLTLTPVGRKGCSVLQLPSGVCELTFPSSSETSKVLMYGVKEGSIEGDYDEEKFNAAQEEFKTDLTKMFNSEEFQKGTPIVLSFPFDSVDKKSNHTMNTHSVVVCFNKDTQAMDIYEPNQAVFHEPLVGALAQLKKDGATMIPVVGKRTALAYSLNAENALKAALEEPRNRNCNALAVTIARDLMNAKASDSDTSLDVWAGYRAVLGGKDPGELSSKDIKKMKKNESAGEAFKDFNARYLSARTSYQPRSATEN